MVLIKREYGAGVSPTALRAAYKVGAYLGKRTASYMQSRSKRRNTGKQSKITSPGPITEQYDVSTRYRRKSMPKYRRRRWRQFTNKVKHVMLQMNALQTYSVDVIDNQTWGINTQQTFGCMLGGTQFPTNDELFQVFRNAYGSGLTTTTVDDYKLFIKSICMDVQITNTGSQGCIVDCYTLIARAQDNVTEGIAAQYSRLYAEQQGANVGAPFPTSPASTPFQNGQFLQKWKVLNKKEVLLGVGNVTTMQLRNAANRTMQGKTIESNPSYIPGYTRAFLFQVRGVPENAAGVAQLCAGTVTFARQWTVTYGIPPQTRNTSADL